MMPKTVRHSLLCAVCFAGMFSSPASAATKQANSGTKLTASTKALSFGILAVDHESPQQVIKLTNSGKSSQRLGVITLSDTANYAMTSTCLKKLAASATCTVGITFQPQTVSDFEATVTISGLPEAAQSITLSGSGTLGTTGTTGTSSSLALHTEPDEGFQWIYTLVNSAKANIDLTMYELVDTTFSADLVAACNRGVKVRVILDGRLEKSSNTAAYSQLNGTTNCSAVFSNTAFQATHEKSMVIDGTTAVIMTFNLTSRYYSETRDFALVENNASDIAAIEATFAADYAAGTPSGGTQGASDLSYQPGTGADLIWSPTTAQADLLAMINNAQKTLAVENEELGAANIVAALESACKRGVAVTLAMTDTSTSYHANYAALESAGCGVHIGANNATTLYVHAKSIIADFGLRTQTVYLGSINFTVASMTENRELGLYVSDAGIVQQINTAIASDYALFPAYKN